jgi:hypothetical protein
MLLFNNSIFYEFMPVEEYGKPHPVTVGLNKVEKNKNYALVISTTGGSGVTWWAIPFSSHL